MNADRAGDVARVLRNRILSALHFSAMFPGDRLPSVREIASEFRVDNRTALRACRSLESAGLVETRQRSGMYIASETASPDPLPKRQDDIADLFARGLQAGFAPASLPGILTEHLLGRRLRVACAASNADHAQTICETVRGQFGVDAYPVTVDALVAEPNGRQLRGALAAVTTVFDAMDVRRAAAAVSCPVFLATVDTGQAEEIRRCLETGPVYIVGADARWAERVRTAFDRTPAGEHLRVIVAGDRALESVPDEVPVFVTPLAAAALAGSRSAARAIILRFGLAAPDATALIRRIVAMNAASSRLNIVSNSKVQQNLEKLIL